MSDADRIRQEFTAAIQSGHGTIELGATVICDACDTDLTDDARSGGYLFGSYGYGPCCADERLKTIRGYGEEGHIRARCPEDMSFADWIRDIRAGSSNQITVRPLGVTR